MHDWEPERYYSMGYGQRQVIKQMLMKELEDRRKEGAQNVEDY